MNGASKIKLTSINYSGKEAETNHILNTCELICPRRAEEVDYEDHNSRVTNGAVSDPC